MLVIGQCHRNQCLHVQKQGTNGEKKVAASTAY